MNDEEMRKAHQEHLDYVQQWNKNMEDYLKENPGIHLTCSVPHEMTYEQFVENYKRKQEEKRKYEEGYNCEKCGSNVFKAAMISYGVELRCINCGHKESNQY